MLPDPFNKFRNMCLKIYQLDQAKICLVSGLKMQAALKKTKVKLDLLNDTDMLLMIEKGVIGEIRHVSRCSSICKS